MPHLRLQWLLLRLLLYLIFLYLLWVVVRIEVSSRSLVVWLRHHAGHVEHRDVLLLEVGIVETTDVWGVIIEV